MTLDQEDEPVLRLKARVFAAGGTPVPVRKSMVPGLLDRIGAGETVYETLIVFGLPATSLPTQLLVEQPLTVIAPVKVPATPGKSGVIVMVPVVVPVTWNTWEKPLPD